MKLNEEIKTLIRNKLSDLKIEAWIEDEQRRIDVKEIDLENDTIIGNRHNYAPWVDGSVFKNGKWREGIDTEYKKKKPLEKIGLLQFKKKIGDNELIIGIK